MEKEIKNKILPIIIFIMVIVISFPILQLLYEHYFLGLLITAGILLLFIGFPSRGWFGNINRPSLYGAQLSVILVFIVNNL